jgi:hypothetical protein
MTTAVAVYEGIERGSITAVRVGRGLHDGMSCASD